MALKGSRPIVVRGVTFRWKFKAAVDGQTRLGGSPRYAHVAVQEDADRPGRPLIAWVESTVWDSTPDAHQPRWGGTLHKARFTPQDVKTLIEAALDDGWDPSGKVQYNSPEGIQLTDHRTYKLAERRRL